MSVLHDPLWDFRLMCFISIVQEALEHSYLTKAQKCKLRKEKVKEQSSKRARGFMFKEKLERENRGQISVKMP